MPRVRVTPYCLCSFLAAATVSADTRLELLARLEPGASVRLATDGGRVVEGRVVSLDAAAVVLDRPPRSVPIETVHAIWVRGRSTGTGAAIGGVMVGVVTGALGALVSVAFCENGDGCGGAGAAGGAIGLAFGGAVGSLTGGVIGATVPRWHRLYPHDAPRHARAAPKSVPITSEPAAERPVSGARVGSASLGLGFARGRDLRAASGGFGGHLRLSTESRGFAPSLEIGRFDLGAGDVRAANGRRVTYDESVLHFGAALTRTLGHGKVRPYGLAALGHYSWRGFDSGALDPYRFDSHSVATRHFFGGSLGGGVRVRSVGPLSFGLEGRWHTSLNEVSQPQFQGAAQHWNMLSITAGASVSW